MRNLLANEKKLLEGKKNDSHAKFWLHIKRIWTKMERWQATATTTNDDFYQMSFVNIYKCLLYRFSYDILLISELDKYTAISIGSTSASKAKEKQKINKNIKYYSPYAIKLHSYQLDKNSSEQNQYIYKMGTEFLLQFFILKMFGFYRRNDAKGNFICKTISILCILIQYFSRAYF